MSQEVFNVNVTLIAGGTAHLGTTNIIALALPGATYGGGITVKKLDYMSPAAIAAASAPQYRLISLDSSCNVIATIGTATASAAWTAGTVRPITLTAANAYVSGTVSYLAVQWIQTAVNANQLWVGANLQYVMGRGPD